MSDINKLFEFYNENGKEFQKEQEKANVIFNLRKKGMLPIISDNKLNIYKIKSNEKINELVKSYEENFYDIYNVLILNNQEFAARMCRSSYDPFFRGMIGSHISSVEEFCEFFELDNEDIKNEFYEEHCDEVEVKIPVDNNMYTRKENIDETFSRIASEYVTCVFKRHSKIASIISNLHYEKCYNLDLIAELACELFYSQSINFSIGTNILDREQTEISAMNFTDREKELSCTDKISVIKEILSAFEIECVYSKEISKMDDSYFNLLSDDNQNTKEIILDFAKHNTDILENSTFTEIYTNVIGESSKTLKKTN